MFNTPDGLSAKDDPANDFDVMTVICEQDDCANEVLIDSDELSKELIATGGVTCCDCTA